jgi:hypothetical protein
MDKWSNWIWMIVIPVFVLSGCAQAQSELSAEGHSQPTARAGSLPEGVMSAAQACKQVLGKAGRGFFTAPEQVHLVLTSYAKGEPAESQGDISSGMPPQTLVWVVEVHAKAINWDHSVPAGYKAPARPDTDFSVVMNARTGYVSDQGECTCWPLPLSKLGTLVSLPPTC